VEKSAPKSSPLSKEYYLEYISAHCCSANRKTQESGGLTTNDNDYYKMRDETNLALANGTTRRQAIVGFAMVFGGLTVGSAKAEGEISRTAESIHQEPVFKANWKLVYEALTDSKQFDKVIQLSGVVQSMHLGEKPAEISREVGGAFTLFGGYITGRQVEPVPGERIVQAWRTGGWAPGVYSIARFELVEQGSGIKIVFDHTGFPNGEAKVLASGWKAHYWEPIDKLLA
jgi:activator of HSP90 ATPase